jgi:integrase
MSETTEKIGRGWHANGGKVPHKGKGSATVEPIRRKKDIAAIKANLAGNLRDLTLFTVGINVGLRGSDLLSLTWGILLSPEGRIRSVIEPREQKTGNSRRIALGDAARKALQAWHKACGEVAGNDLVFPSRKGGRKMTIQRLHQLVNSWCKEAGLRGHYGSHTLRKTYGYFHYEQGTSLPMLMEMFGHSSEAMTKRYIGIRQEEIDAANLKLDL